MWEHREGRVRLPDGRWVHFSDDGPAAAPVVLYCHGVPGSRHEIGWAATALARSGLAVRLVALNRPGYGTTTWRPGGGLRAWASDAAVVLQILAVDSCAVLGTSGGAPYALAFAIENPGRTSRVGLAAGVGPPGLAGMNRSAVWLTEPRGPLRRTVRYGALATGYRAGLGRWLEERMLASLGDVDRRALSDREARSVLHRVVGEAFAQHGQAAAREGGLLLQPWEIDPAHVNRPVHIWHGRLDTRVPVEVAHGLAGLLANASATIWPQHGHFSWATGDAVIEIAARLTT